MRKKLLALALVFALVFALSACGAAAPKEPQKSQEMTDFEAAVDALPTEITYDSWDAIRAAMDAYDALTEEEKTSADTTALDAAKEQYMALPVVADCITLQKKLANPESLKIYGDIQRFTIIGTGATNIFTCVHFDSINSLGVYTGETRSEIVNGTAVCVEGETKLYGVEDMTKYVSVEKLKEMGVEVETVSGKNIADAIGAEYVE
jgi:hypothetical protein